MANDALPFPVAPPAQMRPGALRSDGDSSFDLHTNQAQFLLAGREANRGAGLRRIIGLSGFVNTVAQVRRSAEYDDPFAAWTLIRLDDEDDRTRRMFMAKRQELRLLLKGYEDEGVTFKPLVSSSPVWVPLQFGNNHHAYRAATTLKVYDGLVLLILGCERYGIVDRPFAWQALHQAGRVMRRYLNLPAACWRYTGITRAALHANGVQAQRVSAVYQGLRLPTDLPADILDGTRRSRFGPVVRSPQERASLAYLDDDGEDERGGREPASEQEEV
jgi:integrating conjugative element protein (TIGR03761 family)